MTRPLKVYGWMGWRLPREFQAAFPDSPHRHGQTRECTAAHSKAEVMRIGGGRKSDYFNLGETGNPQAVEAALSEPGVIFWQPLDHRGGYARAS